MSYRPPTAPSGRKSSTPWSRLRPVKQDPLEAIGFVSKGDDRLLDAKIQRSFFEQINTRFMQFCSSHRDDIDEAFTSLSSTERSPSSTTQSIDKFARGERPSPHSVRPSTGTLAGLPASRWAPPSDSSPTASALASANPATAPPLLKSADELSAILTALRKLREGLLATSRTTPSPRFSQQVHVFNVRLAILALHPESYHPSLSYLLETLHTRANPLPEPELNEMTTYMILDLALRRDECVAAYTLRYDSKRKRNYRNPHVDTILRAVITTNWSLFWCVYNQVDGYVRALLYWYIKTMRRTTLKAFGRAYMSVDLKWLLHSTSGGRMTWEELVAEEEVGWSLDGQRVIIRKPKPRS